MLPRGSQQLGVLRRAEEEIARMRSDLPDTLKLKEPGPRPSSAGSPTSSTSSAKATAARRSPRLWQRAGRGVERLDALRRRRRPSARTTGRVRRNRRHPVRLRGHRGGLSGMRRRYGRGGRRPRVFECRSARRHVNRRSFTRYVRKTRSRRWLAAPIQSGSALTAPSNRTPAQGGDPHAQHRRRQGASPPLPSSRSSTRPCSTMATRRERSWSSAR